MNEIFLIFLWLLATLLIAGFSAVIGKRYGVEYPIAIMASLIVVANVLASKVVVLGSLTVTAGLLVYSSTFLITDILSEKWGKKIAKKAVWAGFYANIAFIISIWIAITWQAPPFASEFADKFAEVFSLAPRIVLGSMVAYLISQHHDIWAFHFWRVKTGGKHLWIRNNASTIVSQLIDSVIFATIAFYGVFPILPIILGTWVGKVVIALVDTPFMYGIIKIMDRVKPAQN